MFEARLSEAGILKKVLDAIKDLLTDASFDCTEDGIQVQAMDNSHVSLVSMNLRSDGFENYRCDRSMSMGMNMASLSKIMRCANNDDVVTIKAQDNADVVTFVFESKKGDRVSDFDMKLMNLDQEHLGIPDTDYASVVQMPSGEFARIVRDLTPFGESIAIACSKHGVKFSSTGDIGTGNVKLAQNSYADEADSDKNVTVDVVEPVALTFASRYLNSFAKGAGLSKRMILSMSADVPLVAEFKIATSAKDEDEDEDKGKGKGKDKDKEKEEIEIGYLRYYLAPKIEDDDI